MPLHTHVCSVGGRVHAAIGGGRGADPERESSREEHKTLRGSPFGTVGE